MEWNSNEVQRLGKQAFGLRTFFFSLYPYFFAGVFLVIIAADGEYLAFMQLSRLKIVRGMETGVFEMGRGIEAFLDNDKHDTHIFCIGFDLLLVLIAFVFFYNDFFLEQSFAGLRSAWAMDDMIHGIALLGDESGGLHSFPLLSLFFFE
jgi:hypothetical protein